MNTNPYQSPQSYQDYDDGVEYEYAGFWIRVAAAIIDSILFFVVLFPIFFMLGFMGVIEDNGATFNAIDVLTQIITLVIYVICWVKFAGTPGKKILKLKILDEQTGENITWSQAIVRYVGYIISMLVLLIGVIWVAFDPKKQGWHDKMAKTVVVKEI